MRYLEDTPTFSWTLPGLAHIQRRLGIKIIAGMVNDRPVTGAYYEKEGLTNVGQLNKTEFYKQLAMSSVLVGVGKPRISPSPWDALCMGVPVGAIQSIPFYTTDQSVHQPHTRVGQGGARQQGTLARSAMAHDRYGAVSQIRESM